MCISRITIVAAICIIHLNPIAALAQQSAPRAEAPQLAPQATTATYQDWVVRCETLPGSSRICEVAQGVQAQGQSGLLAQIVVGRPSKEQPFRLIVQLPAGVWLPSGVSLELDEKSGPLLPAYTRCMQACFADLELKPAQLDALKKRSGPGKLMFEDGARNKVQLPLSFRGFSAALEASQEG